MSPCKFTPLAEDGGLTIEIGKRVIKRLTIRPARWRGKGRSDLRADECFCLQLRRGEFEHVVSAALEDSRIH